MTDTDERGGAAARRAAERLTTETLLNCYAREMVTAALWDRPPVHDPVLAARWHAAGRSHWLRLPLDVGGADLFVALSHVSATGRHGIEPPVLLRRRSADARDELTPVGLGALFDLLCDEYRGRAPLSAATQERLRARVLESCDNLVDILAERSGSAPVIDRFLPAEQAMWVAHPYHPLAKSRWGFSPVEVRRYSPEYGDHFQLCYFLADPALVLSDRVGDLDAFAMLREHLLADAATPPPVRAALVRHPGRQLLPVHPWEETYLLGDPAVRRALDRGQLIALGAAGPRFTPTSSLRTVYSEDLPFQLKLSLHVAITNNQRVNKLHELHKGAAVARLLASPLGERMRAELPWLSILRDPAYVAVQIDGEVIEGFSTTVRDNPFRGDQRVAVVGALCEPAIDGPSPMRRLVGELAVSHGVSTQAAAVAWLDAYLRLLLEATVTAHDRFGLSLEVHLQNLGVSLGPDAMPDGLFFRDNQGFFVRHGRAAEALRHSPGLADAGPCVLPEALVDDPIRYYLLVNNVLGVIQAMGSDGVADEPALVEVLDARLRSVAARDESGLVRDIVDARTWPAKGNLLMALEDQDELERPVESPAPYVGVPNPILPLAHRAASVLAPRGPAVVYRHHFDDYGAALALRPLDLERDLGLLHAWSHEDYARPFWQNDVPMRELEAWYLEMLASPHHHAFLGFLGDEPSFVVETYWAPGDVVGRHYPATPGDHGVHLLVAPARTPLPRFTRRCLQVATEMLFRHREVARVVAEPDHRNDKAIRVFAAVGYQSHGDIDLPDKRASLLVCTRDSLVAACPDARHALRVVSPEADTAPARRLDLTPRHPDTTRAPRAHRGDA